jgi:predicted  nucleic acid-binding Zn-ribbon protein
MQPNRLRFLKVAEYTSLAASVAGVVISTATRQVIYAVAPVSISMFLNLLNRQRFEQQTQQNLAAAIAQVDQQLSQLNRAFSTLQQEVTSELTQQSGLQNRFAAIESLNLDTVPQTLVQLQGQFDNLLASISRIDQRLNSFSSTEQANSLKIEIDQLQTDLQQQRNNLQTAISQQQTELQAQFDQRFSQLVQTLSVIQQQLQSQESASESVALENIQQGLTQLQNRIAAVEAFNLRSTLQSIAQLQGQYDTLLASTSKIDQRLGNFPSAEQVDSLKAEIDQIQVDLGQLQTNLQQEQNDLQAALEQLQTELHALLEQSPSSERNLIEDETLLIEPFIASQDDNRTIESLFSLLDDEQGGDDEDIEELELDLLDLNLGIDFGTSFTKVCFRDIARDSSEIVTFTSGQAELDEALLPTKIAILADGTLIAGLTTAEWEAFEQPIQTSVQFIKMRLADLDIPQTTDGWRLEHLPELDRADTVENLCAYYLSCVITRAQSWIRNNKPDLVLNQKLEWAANVGVPVEYCDSPALARFKKVLSLAWLLSNEPQTERFTIQRLGDCLKPLRSRILNNPIDCHAIPEISAGVWSFLNSREADEGFYVFFDVGDGTLDGVSFRYWREEGEPKVDFYSSSVQPLGVSAISKPLATELNVSEVQVKRAIFNQQNSDLAHLNSTPSRKQIQRLVGSVVMNGYQKHGTHRPVFKTLEFQKGLSLFIGGGGGMTSFYKKAIMDTHSNFQHKNVGIPSYLQKGIPTPKDLSMSGLNTKEFHRFAVAYGLSIPDGGCPDVRLPSEMEKAEPQQLGNTSNSSRLRYEDSRDSC